MALVDVDLRPDEKKLKQFGFVALVAFALLGGFLLWRVPICCVRTLA